MSVRVRDALDALNALSNGCNKCRVSSLIDGNGDGDEGGVVFEIVDVEAERACAMESLPCVEILAGDRLLPR